jgi:hypothetical protein
VRAHLSISKTAQQVNANVENPKRSHVLPSTPVFPNTRHHYPWREQNRKIQPSAIRALFVPKGERFVNFAPQINRLRATLR